jgi:cold shock protein
VKRHRLCRRGGIHSHKENLPVKHTGSVVLWRKHSGFGFIKPDQGDDVFVHISAVDHAGLDNLHVGQRLEFDIRPDRRDTTRLRAVHLRAVA